MITYQTDKLQKVLLSGGCEQNGTPTPDTPVDIVCNNGVLKVNRNLYSTEYHDKTLSQSDGITAGTNGGVNVSAMVDCTNVKSFMITSTTPKGSYRIFKYRPDGTFINATTTSSIGQVLILPSDCGYFRIQYNYTSEIGSNTENILIYNSAYDLNDIYTEGTVETVTATGKNLFDISASILGGLSSTNGSETGSTARARTDFIDINTSRITVSIDANDNFGIVNSYYYDENKNYIGNIGPADPSGAIRNNTFTVPNGSRYVRVTFCVYNSPVSGINIGTFRQSKIQIESGSTATTYEPYFNGGTATAEMLLKVGDYEDVQSVLDGKVTRNVGIKVLDGTESFVTNIVTGCYTLTPYIGAGNFDYKTVYCSHLKSTAAIPAYDSGTGYAFITNVDNNYTVSFGGTGIWSSISAFKQFLTQQYNAGTPVIVVYPLATPTTEQVTPQPLAGNNVTQTAGSIDNLPIESSTIEELKKRYIGDNEVERVYIGDNLITILKVGEPNAEFYKRKTGGTQSVGSGIAAIKEIRGKSIVWNQIINNSDFTNSENVAFWSSNKFTKSFNDNSMELSYDGDVSLGSVMNASSDAVVGHKYLALYMIKASTPTTCGAGHGGDYKTLVWQVGTSWNVYGYILTAKSTDRMVYAYAQLGSGNKVNIRYVNMFDLTLMFGAGNEPSTVAEFEKIFPLNYYNYNAGEVIPFAGQNLVTTGKNQYNPATGKANLLGGQTYQIGGTYTSAEIDGVAVTLDSNNCFTTTNDCVLDVTGGNDTDTIVALYNGENVSYEPYEKHTLPLDPSQWRDTNNNLVFPYGGMHGNSFYWDYAKVDADGYIRRAVRVWGLVDLGNFSYTNPNTASFYFYCPNDWVKTGTDRGNNIICERYISNNNLLIRMPNKSIGGSGSAASICMIKDNGYSTAAELKASLNGVACYYRLNTPVEVELATPIYAKYLVDKDGTEEITPGNGTTPYTTMANLHLSYPKK